MSQITKTLTSGGPIPPIIPTSFVTDVNSPAIPAANVLNVLGNDTTVNNDNGIRTDGSSGSNTLTVQLTNRLQGTGNTTGVGITTVNMVTFSLGATPSTFVIDANICAFNSSTPAGAGYSIFGTVRTDGATASLVQTPDKISNEDAVLSGCTADISVSGNDVIISGTGVNGLSVNWSAVATYVQVS